MWRLRRWKTLACMWVGCIATYCNGWNRNGLVNTMHCLVTIVRCFPMSIQKWMMMTPTMTAEGTCLRCDVMTLRLVIAYCSVHHIPVRIAFKIKYELGLLCHSMPCNVARVHVCGKEMTIPAQKHDVRMSGSTRVCAMSMCGKGSDALLKQLTATFVLFVNENDARAYFPFARSTGDRQCDAIRCRWHCVHVFSRLYLLSFCTSFFIHWLPLSATHYRFACTANATSAQVPSRERFMIVCVTRKRYTRKQTW